MENPVAKIFKVLTYLVFGVGFIAGFVIGKTENNFSWSITFYVWIACFVQGMIFLAIREFIILAEDRNEYLKNIALTISKENKQNISEIMNITNTPSDCSPSYVKNDSQQKSPPKVWF